MNLDPQRWAKEMGIKGVVWLTIGLLIGGAIIFSYARPAKVAVDTAAAVVRSPDGLQCPSGWARTDGRDPDGRLKTRTCTSADKRYIITARETGAPEGLDAVEKRFLSPDEIDAVLK